MKLVLNTRLCTLGSRVAEVGAPSYHSPFGTSEFKIVQRKKVTIAASAARSHSYNSRASGVRGVTETQRREL